MKFLNILLLTFLCVQITLAQDDGDDDDGGDDRNAQSSTDTSSSSNEVDFDENNDNLSSSETGTSESDDDLNEGPSESYSVFEKVISHGTDRIKTAVKDFRNIKRGIRDFFHDF
ncbi:unnamed protein product, partial [Iphiclides podalirius]